MKVVGNIIPNDENDTTYINGTIIHLTEEETNTFKALQDAWQGDTFYFLRGRGNLSNMEMSSVFKAVHLFIETKFSINQLKDTVKTLEEIVGNNEL